MVADAEWQLEHCIYGGRLRLYGSKASQVARIVGEHSEVFVGFDTAKLKHAVALAEAGREGEVRFLGEIENRPATIEKMLKKLTGRYRKLHVSKRGRRDTGSIGKSRRWVMTAWW